MDKEGRFVFDTNVIVSARLISNVGSVLCFG